MKTITKKSVMAIEKEILAAIQKISDKHGVKFTGAGGNFCAGDATLKFKMTLTNPAKGSITTEQRAYDLHSPMYDLPKRGEVVELQGELYELIGWKTRAPKYPILAKKKNGGGTYKLSIEQVESAQGKA